MRRNAKLYSVYSASNVRRLCALLCPPISFVHFHVRHFHVLQFHALQIGPSISRPSFSRPAFSAPPTVGLIKLSLHGVGGWKRKSASEITQKQ